MQKEFTDHYDLHHWDLIPIEDAYTGARVLDSVWAMRRKRNVLTGKHTSEKVEFTWRSTEIRRKLLRYLRTCRQLVLLLIYALINK